MAKITGAGVLGTYETAGGPVAGTDEVQTITVVGTPDGGTYKLSFEGFVTAALAHDANAAAIQTALRALPSIGATGIGVTGTGPFVCTFAANLGKKAIGSLIALHSNDLTGDGDEDVTIAETTPGVNASARGAAKGALLIDTTNGLTYQNTGTPLAPTWGLVGEQGT